MEYQKDKNILISENYSNCEQEPFPKPKPILKSEEPEMMKEYNTLTPKGKHM